MMIKVTYDNNSNERRVCILIASKQLNSNTIGGYKR